MFAGFAATAQSKETKTADALFGSFEYVDAAKEYLKLTKKGDDPYVYKQLADSYYNLFNAKEAIRWYGKATESKQDAETYYRYAQMLKVEGNYEEANKQMQKFAKLAPKDQRAIIFKKDPDYLPKLRNQTKLFDEKILKINDKKHADFAPVLANDGTFYFTSSRNTARRKYGRNEQPYLDIYEATYDDTTGAISKPKALSAVNTRWHDGPIAITADGNTMYFASESFANGDFDKESSAKQRTGLIYLFIAKKQDGKWGNVKPVPFNSNSWSTGNPTISKDGKTLYFTSNRDGSIGNTDIWKVAVNGYNSFGQPENLGKDVNTEGKETFPFITDDNKLYFSSNGHKGFGGLDIFMIDLANGSETINVGAPVNSPQDDFSFSFNYEKNIGFFASNRKDKDNMYMAIPVCGVEAIVIVKDANTGNPLASAKVAILDDMQNVIETRTTDKDGRLTYSVDCDRTYSLKASTNGYETSMFRIEKTREQKIDVIAKLKPIGNLIVDGKVELSSIYFEYNKSNVTPEAAFELNKLVEAMKEQPQLKIEVKAHTDNRGNDAYNLKLSDQRAKATVQYVISKGIDKSRISGQGYGESQLKVDCGENCTEEQHAINRRTEFIIVQ